MQAADALALLGRLNVVAAAAIMLVLALRVPVRRVFGPRLAYALWFAIPLTLAAALLPAPVRPPEPDVSMIGAPPSPAAAQAPAAVTSPYQGTPVDPSPYLLGLWLVGVGAAGGISTFRQRRFLSMAKKGLVGPALVGVMRPRVILPDDFTERFSEEERRMILTHEEVHRTGQDSRLNGLVLTLQCVNWFNPMVHLGAHFLRVDQELSCDAAVVARFPDARRAYAEVLLKTQLATTPLLAGCYWPARAEHPLNRRIAMLKSPSPSSIRRRAGLVIITGATLFGGVAAWAMQPPRPVGLETVRAAPAPSQAPPTAKAEPAAPKVSAAIHAVFPETKPPLVSDARAAGDFASVEKTIATNLVPRPASVARENPQASSPPYVTPPALSPLDVESLRTVLDRRIAMANEDLAFANKRFEIGAVTRTDVARAELKSMQAEAAVQQLDVALRYLGGVREEYQVGLRTSEDVDRAEQQVFGIVAGQALSGSR